MALVIICGLAFIPSTIALADKTALFAVGLAGAIFAWTPLIRQIQYSPQRSAFFLTAAMFLIYGIARTAGPNDGFSLQFAALPGDKFVVPYSAYIVVFTAILTGPYWWFHRFNSTYALLSGIVLVGVLSFFSFLLLKCFFPAGTTEILDPTPLPTLSMLLVEYGSVALLCHAVAARRQTRRLALRILPITMLVLAARHQFFPAAEDGE